MEETVEELVKKYILLEHGLPEQEIENLFIGYNAPELINLRYRDVVDGIVKITSEKNFQGEDLMISFIEKTMENYSEITQSGGPYKYSYKKLLQQAVEPSSELEEITKDELKRLNISKKDRESLSEGCGNPKLTLYGYKDAIDNAIDDVYEKNLKGKDAKNYIEERLSEWAEFLDEYPPILNLEI